MAHHCPKFERLRPSRERAGVTCLGDILAPEANSFGLLRLTMALLVLVSHGYFLGAGTTAAEPLHAWTGHALGEHAVQVFFFLSGILIAQSFERSRSLLDFAAARLLRIFPALAVCVLLAAFAIGPLVSGLGVAQYFASRGVYDYVLRTLSLATGSAPLPGVFADNPAPALVNLSLWTLKYEVLCYLGLALAGLAGLFAPARRGGACVLLAVFLATVFIDAPKPIETFTPLDNMRYFALYFGMGSLAYLLRDRLVIRARVLLVLAPLFALGLGTRFGELTTALFLGYATLCAAAVRYGPLRSFANRIDLSYGTYIFACPVQQIILERASHLAPEWQIILAVAIVLPLALLSWHAIERPAIGLRRALVARLQNLPRPVPAALSD